MVIYLQARLAQLVAQRQAYRNVTKGSLYLYNTWFLEGRVAVQCGVMQCRVENRDRAKSNFRNCLQQSKLCQRSKILQEITTKVDFNDNFSRVPLIIKNQTNLYTHFTLSRNSLKTTPFLH